MFNVDLSYDVLCAMRISKGEADELVFITKENLNELI